MSTTTATTTSTTAPSLDLVSYQKSLAAATSKTTTTASTATTGGSTLDKNSFMQLMVTQLQNQDPLNPSDNQQMAAQLAQFTSLESLQNIQTSIEGLSKTLTDAQTAQTSAANLNSMGSAVALLGRTIQLKQATISAPSTGQTTSIPVQATSGSVLAIQDSTGKTVRTLPLNGTDTNGSSILDSTGNGTVSWDGKDDNGVAVTAGTYTLSVQDSASGAATGYAYTVGAVTGIGQDSGGTTLQTAAGTFHLSDLVQVGSTSSTSSSNSAASSEAIALIGHTVKLRDPSATLSNYTSGTSWAFTANTGAKGQILDSSGNVVSTFTPTIASDGTGSYSWNSQTSSGAVAPLGTYRLQLVSADGTSVAGAAYKQVKVDGTGFDSTGQPLLLSGDNAWSLSALYTAS